MAPEPVPAQPTDAWREAWPQSKEDFERLVETYLRRLVSYAFRRLRNIHDAEDVVQEVFVRAYAQRFKRADISPVGPYLYRMAANACTDLLRKRRRSEAPMDRIEGENLPDGRGDASMLYATVEEVRRAEGLLRRLPRKQAEVVRLRVFDELRVNEIAAVVGCSANTVSSRLRYGFKKLRKIVSREWRQ